MKTLHIDFDRKVGEIKPVNGLNNGPLTCNFSQDARPYYKKAGIPFSRLHDTEYPMGSGEFVDVSCLFKNFRDDENDPENYNFTLTDEYLKAICECGTKIIYRLGATIEHQPVKVHVQPPKDYLKWARICEHIIRHYNEGWANGLHLGIEYWEIWNEPDIEQCWTGSPQDYFRFYITVTRYLKSKFPHLKFGGPTCCSVWSDFARDFLRTIAAEKERVPLDFFSWHCYTVDPKLGAESARHLDGLLKEFGYPDAESIYDEWNYVKDWSRVTDCYKVIRSAKGAAYDAAMMIALQHSPCTISTYYDGQTKFAQTWCGLFDMSLETVHGAAGTVQVRKPYYAFEAFAALAALGSEVLSGIDDGNVFACAAAGDAGKAVLLSNYHDEACAAERVRVRFDGQPGLKLSVYRLDRAHDLEKTGEIADGGTLTMGANCVVLLKTE